MRWKRFWLNVNTHSGNVNTYSGKYLKSVHVQSGITVHVQPVRVFMLDRYRCSPCSGICNCFHGIGIRHSNMTVRSSRFIIAKRGGSPKRVSTENPISSNRLIVDFIVRVLSLKTGATDWSIGEVIRSSRLDCIFSLPEHYNHILSVHVPPVVPRCSSKAVVHKEWMNDSKGHDAACTVVFWDLLCSEGSEDI